MCREQPFDFGSTLVVGARLLEKRDAFLLRTLERGMKQRLEMPPPIV